MIFSRKTWFFFLALVSSLALQPTLSQAATFCVNEQADDGTGNAGDCPDAACTGSAGTCSLRDAIENADSNPDSDTITFSSSLTSPLMIEVGDSIGLPTIFFPVQIVGPGADVLTVAIGNGSNNVFWFDAEEQPRSYSISGLTITNLGDSGFPDKIIQHRGTLTISDTVITGRGRGISCFGEELTIQNSSIVDNFTSSGDGSSGAGLNFGGGVDNGILTITNSTFSGNQKLNTSGIDVDEGGGAIGIFDGSSLFDGTDFNISLTNVTFSGNQTNENGGGIWISDDCAECGSAAAVIHATLTNVTLAANDADLNGDGGEGGGIFVSLSNPGASVVLNNTLIADNVTGGAGASDCSVNGISLGSNGFNLVEDDTDCAGLSGSDITGQDPLLAALSLNPPGTTETQALDSNSPAINAGDNADCPDTDQRGVPRPQGSACDIGAYEAVVCGDGTVGPGEECEPSNECCTDLCLFADAGTSCDDGNPDTFDEECDGSGVCEGIPDGGGDLDGGGCSLSPRSNPAWSLSSILAAALGLMIFRRLRLSARE
ncbi:MAG TPA: choice-of-anchor Q domain-containing protein [bacterium]|nr:choice-of-anchor Q domain-containing protein [bacterium]